MIGMAWRGTHAADFSICRDLGPPSRPSTMRDARSGAIFLDRDVRLEPTRRGINALLHCCAALIERGGTVVLPLLPLTDQDLELATTDARPHPYGSDPPLQPTAMAYGKFS